MRCQIKIGRLLPNSWQANIAKNIEEYYLRKNISICKQNEHARSGALIVSRFTDDTMGIGKAGNLTLRALKDANYNVTHELDISDALATRRGHTLHFPKNTSGGIWIIHANAPEAAVAMSRMHWKTWAQMYRIGYWAYELPNAPKNWKKVSALFHEIWVPSQFSADSLKDALCPVRVLPHPTFFSNINSTRFNTPKNIPKKYLKQLGLPIFNKVVVSMADVRSSIYRKNILGAVNIFTTAFPENQNDVLLVVKLSHTHARPADIDHIREAALGRTDIRIMTKSLTDQQMSAFRSCWDVLLSPHRAEGFGLTLAESLRDGIPILATAWSGNMEFMRGLTPFLIDYDLVPVKDPTGIYQSSHNNFWAEPNIENAADKLKFLLANADTLDEWLIKGQSNLKKLIINWKQDLLLDHLL